MKRAAVIAALGVASWIGIDAAQAPTPQLPTPPFRSGRDLVTLDVSVLDQRRQPVRGLTVEDFAVFEGSERRAIVAFKAIDLPDRVLAGAPWLRDVAPDVVTNRATAERVVVLLLDDINVAMDPADIFLTKKIAQGIVDQLGPADLAAVVYTFNHENGQEFTNDRSRLLAAVDRFKSAKFPALAGGPPVESMACPHNECVTSALRSIAEVLRDNWPGQRKTVAFVSPEGQYSIGPQNLEQHTELDSNIGLWDSLPDLQRTFRTLQEANVNVYQYDPRGLSGSLGVVNIAGATSTLGMFAGNSGGAIVTHTNAPEARVAEMFIENSSYYMLGITPSDTKKKDAFRPVKVTVARDGVEVRARSGYYGPTIAGETKPSKKPPASALDKAMTGALPTGDIAMSLTVVPFMVPGPIGSTVAVVAGLDRSSEFPAKDIVEIAARAFNEATADRKSKGVATAKLQLTRRPTATSTVHYDVATRLDLAPGRYEIRLAMDSAETHLTGSAFASVTVPDFAKAPLSLSGVVLTRIPATRATGKDTLLNLLPFTPTTARAFERTDRVASLIRIYQGGKEAAVPIRVTARLIDQTDRKVFERADTVAPDIFLSTARTAEHRFELPLARLEPGEYLLAIEAVAGKMTEIRRVRLRMN